MSRRHFDLALSDTCLLVGSALLLALIGLALSRDTEVTAQRAKPSAPVVPAGAAAADMRTARPAQQISSDSLAPSWNDPPRQSGWVF